MTKEIIKNISTPKNDIQKLNEDISNKKLEMIKKGNQIDDLESLIDKFFTVKQTVLSKKGETLVDISNRTNSSLYVLERLNSFYKDGKVISEGQSIILPNTYNKKGLSTSQQKLIDDTISKINKEKTALNKLNNDLQELIYIQTKYELSTILNDAGNIPISENQILVKTYKNGEYLKYNYDFYNQLLNKYTNLDGGISEKLKEIGAEQINDIKLQKEKNEIKEIEELLEYKEGKNFRQYMYLLEKYRKNPAFKDEIPLKTLLILLINEGSNGITTRKNPTTSAVGLGQITDDTWFDLCKTFPNKKEYKGNISINFNKRYDAEEQIKAICLNLDVCARKHKCSYQEAVVYYHMGLYADDISDTKAQNYANNNAKIKKAINDAGIKKVTKDIYMTYAANFYSTPSIDKNLNKENLFS